MPENRTDERFVQPPAPAAATNEQPSLSKVINSARGGGNRSLANAANLANLLPTGTVLLFQALVPSFSNNGKCERANQYLTLALVFFCSVACFFSSFTDSFYGRDNKLYHGMATCNGFWVFNDDRDDGFDPERNQDLVIELKDYRLTLIDFVHALSSLILFLVVCMSSDDVQRCFFELPDPNTSQVIKNLPLAAGILASALFTLFPTRRRGIGYAENYSQPRQK